MGAYCQVPLPRHAATQGETLEVMWSDYYGAALFGDRMEIACIPHKGCRLEIVATALTEQRDLSLLLPGQVLHYKRAFYFLDQLVLPNGRKANLGRFVGFKLRLAPAVAPLLPTEELVVRRAREAQRGTEQQPVLR